MKLRRSAKLTADSSSVTMSSTGHHEVPRPNTSQSQFKSYPPSRKARGRPCAKMTFESPSFVASKRPRESSVADPMTTKLGSNRAKKRRLESVFYRVCVICTDKVEEELEFLEAESVLERKLRLDQFSTLLGSCQLNTLDSERWTVCDNCCSRLDELISILDNIKSLEIQVNQLADGLYTDLEKSFPTNEDGEQSDSPDEVVYYRSQLFENRKTFVLEAKPQTNIIFEVTYLTEGEDAGVAGQPGNSMDEFPLHDMENDWTEELSNDADPQGFKVDGHHFENTGTNSNDETVAELKTKRNSDPFEEPKGEYLCSYVGSDDAVPCRLAFYDKKAFDMHTRAHGLEINLGTSKNVVEKRGLEIYNEMLKQQETLANSDSLQCPLCGKAPFELGNLKRHITKVHKFKIFPCPRASNKKKKCPEFFTSDEELQNHLQSCSMKPLTKMKQDEGAEAVYPQRVENDEMDCAICVTNHSRTITGYIRHMLQVHGRRVCIQKDVHEVACLGAFKTDEGVQQHLREEHNLDLGVLDDLESLYLDPNCHKSQCSTCGKKGLEKQLDYISHVREHGIFACGKPRNGTRAAQVCTRTFDRQRDLDLHLSICGSHTRKKVGALPRINKLVWCRFCKFNATYTSRAEWLDHVKKHDAFPCNIYQPDKKRYCKQLFMLRSLLKLHIETDHPDVVPDEVAGPIDNGGWTGIDVLNDESSNAIRGLPIEDRYECKICPATFDVYDQAWVDHVRSHGSMICDVIDKSTGRPCLALFFGPEKLALHCRKKHEKLLEGGYHCKVCDRGCESLEVWKRHQRFHGSKRGLVCDKCGKEGPPFKVVYSCTCNSESFSCDTCGKEFKKNALLRQHIEIHHEGFRHVCKVCGVEYKTITALNHHSFRKHGEGASASSVYECSVCQQKFVSKGLRDCHFRVRHGERRHKCDRDNCDWAFQTVNALKKHISHVHENARPFMCAVCGSTFKSQGHWATHMKKHDAGEAVKPVREVDRKPKPWTGESVVKSPESSDETGNDIIIEYS